MIEHIRGICALKSLICKIKDRGAVAIGFEEAGKFVTAARAVTDTIDAIESEDLNKVYRDFVSLLEVTFINNQKNFDCSKLKNKEVIQQISREENSRTFSSVCIILQCICAAAVNLPVESVGLVFRYEHDFSSSRQPPRRSCLERDVNCIKRPTDKYWKEHNINVTWHFLRHTADIRSYTGNASNVVGKLLKEN